MMSESSAVDCRQDKLEEDNHRLKLTVGALLLVLASGMGSTPVCRHSRTQSPNM